MLTLADRTRNFWCAAFYCRRAETSRDRSVAVKVLQQVTTVTKGKVKDRAETMLREINVTDEHAPRAG
jgi:hypothetical protein